MVLEKQRRSWVKNAFVEVCKGDIHSHCRVEEERGQGREDFTCRDFVFNQKIVDA